MRFLIIFYQATKLHMKKICKLCMKFYYKLLLLVQKFKCLYLHKIQKNFCVIEILKKCCYPIMIVQTSAYTTHWKTCKDKKIFKKKVSKYFFLMTLIPTNTYLKSYYHYIYHTKNIRNFSHFLKSLTWTLYIRKI